MLTSENLRKIRTLTEDKNWQLAEKTIRPFIKKGESQDELQALHRLVRRELARLCEYEVKGFAYLGHYTYNCAGFSYTVGEYEHLQTGLDFVLLPPNQQKIPYSFKMGSSFDEENRGSDETEHLVVFTQRFLVSKTPVTQGVWTAIIGVNPSHFEAKPDYPVEQVSWDFCQIFCKKTGLSLLTEAQWEYAARGGTSGAYCFGHKLKEEQSNFQTTGRYLEGEHKTTAVGFYPSNAFGLYDMHGNVNEWCQDWYGAYGKARIEDPLGPKIGLHRIYRGGSMQDEMDKVRSACRNCIDPNYLHRSLGFRVGKTLP